jgi:hypothetical protein
MKPVARTFALDMALLVPIVALTLSLPPAAQAKVVAEARKAEGVAYHLGGRLGGGRAKVEGLDCQGLVFFALQSLTSCGWRSWSVNPTESVKGELGKPVDGLEPVAAADLEAKLDELEPGDVVWFLDPTQNPAEPALTALAETPHWVWHVGLYTGDGNVITGDPFAGEVKEEPLVAYVNAHYAGIYVTRMERGPKAAQCKAHAPMKLAPPSP